MLQCIGLRVTFVSIKFPKQKIPLMNFGTNWVQGSPMQNQPTVLVNRCSSFIEIKYNFSENSKLKLFHQDLVQELATGYFPRYLYWSRSNIIIMIIIFDVFNIPIVQGHVSCLSSAWRLPRKYSTPPQTG